MYIGYIANKRHDVERIEWWMGLSIFVIGIICIMVNPIRVVSFDDNSYGNLVLMIIGAVATNIGIVFFY